MNVPESVRRFPVVPVLVAGCVGFSAALALTIIIDGQKAKTAKKPCDCDEKNTVPQMPTVNGFPTNRGFAPASNPGATYVGDRPGAWAEIIEAAANEPDSE